jgi:ElaB/YqjD/DUF883 family membrane-anchored ribosome-binding protein
MPSLVFPALVRTQILEQHRELRALLEEVLRIRASSAHPPGPAAPSRDARRLAHTAEDLCERFQAHLAFEQAALTPIFAIIDAWGPERVKDLCDEHERQRRELDRLRERFQREDDVERRADALRGLADELLRDMDEEEAGCLRASLLSADSLFAEPPSP